MTQSILGTLLALAVFGPGQAWADSTLIIRPTGTAKQRNLDKVTKSFTSKAKGMADISVGSFDVGADCIADLECMASAGKDAGVDVVVGVHVARNGPSFTLLFVAVHSVSGQELARQEVSAIKRKALGDMASATLDEFLTTLPSAPPASAEPAPEPVDELPVEAEPAALAEPDISTLEEPEFETEPVVAAAELQAGTDIVASDEGASYMVEIGLGTGVVLPQLWSELSTTAGVELDVGVPVWKSLSVVGAVAYAQPLVESDLSDPRITDTMYNSETTQRELTLTLGATWRFLEKTSRSNVYAGLGPRVWLLETRTNGSAGGMEFGENQERSTRFGGAGWAGAEFLIGPGAVAAELDVGGSDLPHLVTGDVATTAVAVQVGYRLRL